MGGPQAETTPVTAFPRDRQTGLQVWSGDTGYPADGKHILTSTRSAGLAAIATGRSRWRNRIWSSSSPTTRKRHARGLSSTPSISPNSCIAPSKASSMNGSPPISASLFDAELFGHWWFEGPQWLEHVARTFTRKELPIALTTSSEYLTRYPASVKVTMNEGSWGKNGNNEVWLNDQTSWTWSHIYRAERVMRDVASDSRWRDGEWGERIAKQMARELLLLESSDWQFLITTAAARDYAEKRFNGHLHEFRELETIWAEYDQVVPELVALMTGAFQDTNRPHAMQWRDGLPYQHNLAATRAVMDHRPPTHGTVTST